MSEYGEQDPMEQTRPQEPVGEPAEVAAPQAGPAAAPTWSWIGGQASHSVRPPVTPFFGPAPDGAATGQPLRPLGAPVPRSTGPSRRLKIAGAAAAVLLLGGAAAGGAAFGYAHTSSGGTASGIVSGAAPGSGSAGSGSSGDSNPGSGPSQVQPPSIGVPPNDGSGHTPRHRRGGRASSYAPPGHANANQQVGVVDIDTLLKYQVAKAAGTGMILTADGEILTNNHVIEGATKIRVTVVATGRSYAATVVGTDKVDDIAVLQLTGASGLATITPDRDGVQLGDAITAVGNAMGVGGIPSAAEGNVIGLDKSITTQSEGGVQGERLTGLIQVDAQVISGDSGGPLYDAQNEVIGMDTAASSSPLQSVGFAIPIAKALSVADKIENGEAGGNITLGVPGFLGVQFQPGSRTGNGAVITAVVPNTPAAGVDLVPGDVVTGLSGATVTSGEQLKTLLAHYQGGDSVSLTWRDTQGGSHTASVTLIDGPAG